MKRYLKYAAIFMTALFGVFQSAMAVNEHIVGQWSTLPYLMPINPIHVAQLPNNKILVVAGSEADPAWKDHWAAILDLSAGTVVKRKIAWDLFCNAMSFFPDGRVLITGGTDSVGRYKPFYGAPFAIFYNPFNDTFTEGPRMSDGRWYPTNTVMADSRTLVIGGYSQTGPVSRTIEIFDPAGSGSWTKYPISFSPALYPRGHLEPNGIVFYAGPERASRRFNPVSLKWTQNVALTNHGSSRTFGSSILLPLSPPNYAASVLIMGGNSTATNTAERIDLAVSPPKWKWVASMAKARNEHNSTLLPNGYALVTGGSAKRNVASTASRNAEWFNPATNSWATLSPAVYARLYHSVALLMPDGRVWTAGSNPGTRVVERHMEIFSPPYLFTTNTSGQVILAPRPSISALPPRIGYGAAFDIGTPIAADIASVALIRLGSVTHSFDMEQRMVKLSTSVVSSGTLRAVAPPHSAVAPQGYYMLFLVNSRGTPSVARFVQLI